MIITTKYYIVEAATSVWQVLSMNEKGKNRGKIANHILLTIRLSKKKNGSKSAWH